jgi:hypothetical protein
MASLACLAARPIVAISLFASVLLAACGSEELTDEVTPSISVPTANEKAGQLSPQTTIAPLKPGRAVSDPPLWNAQSLRSMVEFYETIIVGHVDAVAEVRYPDSVQPDGSRVELPPETVFSVSVVQVISAPRATQRETFSLLQLGGPTKEGVPFLLDGDPLVYIGETYLMFLNDLTFRTGSDLFSGPAFGRFVVTNGGLIVPNGWEASPGVSAVSGVSYAEVEPTVYADNPDGSRAGLARISTEDAASKILNEIALAPLPPLPATTLNR